MELLRDGPQAQLLFTPMQTLYIFLSCLYAFHLSRTSGPDTDNYNVHKYLYFYFILKQKSLGVYFLANKFECDM